jgi:hypothetical protein
MNGAESGTIIDTRREENQDAPAVVAGAAADT